MDKVQAIHKFWSSFGLTAYDQNTVPDDAQMPYITYDVSVGALENVLILTGSLWYHSSSWKEISEKSDAIAKMIGSGYYIDKVDDGYVWITRGNPFAQRMSDGDKDVRRIYIVLNAEFLTAF